MIAVKILINSIEEYIKVNNVPKDLIDASKIKQILQKTSQVYRADSIFDQNFRENYYTVIDYFSKKYNFAYRKKKLQNFYNKDVYESIHSEKIELETAHNVTSTAPAKECVYVYPHEILIVYRRTIDEIFFLLNNQKIVMKKSLFKRLVTDGKLKHVETISSTDLVL